MRVAANKTNLEELFSGQNEVREEEPRQTLQKLFKDFGSTKDSFPDNLAQADRILDAMVKSIQAHRGGPHDWEKERTLRAEIVARISPVVEIKNPFDLESDTRRSESTTIHANVHDKRVTSLQIARDFCQKIELAMDEIRPVVIKELENSISFTEDMGNKKIVAKSAAMDANPQHRAIFEKKPEIKEQLLQHDRNQLQQELDMLRGSARGLIEVNTARKLTKEFLESGEIHDHSSRLAKAWEEDRRLRSERDPAAKVDQTKPEPMNISFDFLR